MKLKKIIAGLAVSVMICTAVMSSAGAYFTDYDEAAGDKSYAYNMSTDLVEKVTDHKELTIDNTGDITVTIRARAYAGAEYEDLLEYSGTDWTDGGDGWWYYGPEVAPNGSTSELNIKVNLPTEGDDIEVGQVVNVIVVYEAFPVEAAD